MYHVAVHSPAEAGASRCLSLSGKTRGSLPVAISISSSMLPFESNFNMKPDNAQRGIVVGGLQNFLEWFSMYKILNQLDKYLLSKFCSSIVEDV